VAIWRAATLQVVTWQLPRPPGWLAPPLPLQLLARLAPSGYRQARMMQQGLPAWLLAALEGDVVRRAGCQAVSCAPDVPCWTCCPGLPE
jgi:hypothetical protein